MASYAGDSNPFTEGEEVGEGGFCNKPQSKKSYGGPYSDNGTQIQEMIDEAEDKQVESSKRTLAYLYESERIGLATAEDLTKQGEQLDNIEKKTTEINQSLKTTQKHLNNIKSVFGGFKNWWTSKKNDPEDNIPEPRKRKLKNTQEKERSTAAGQNQALKTKSGDYSTGQFIQPITNSHKEEQLNKNIGEISDGVSRLKDLTLQLGDKIDEQNHQLDRINPRTDHLNLKVEDQNKQMRGILKKS